MDMFGANAPVLNINGTSSINTFTGACFSILTMSVATLFALLKLQFLLIRKSPDVISVVEASHFDSTETTYNIAENDFMTAISVDHYDKGARMDPRYV